MDSLTAFTLLEEVSLPILINLISMGNDLTRESEEVAYDEL
jgi:hypothetical protein